jgi:hypothetical protein
MYDFSRLLLRLADDAEPAIDGQRSAAATPEHPYDHDRRRAPARLFDERRIQVSFRPTVVDESPDSRGLR